KPRQAARSRRSMTGTSSALPLSSLRLLVPPLRLLTAAMWQVARHQSVKHYGMLGDFVSMVTEAVPELLTNRQRSLLLLALRAKVSAPCFSLLEECCSALLSLSAAVTQSPGEAQRLLQEVFDQNFDSALQSLVSDLLSRIEQLFPIPDFKQVVLLGGDSEKTLLSVWSHPLFTRLTNPERPDCADARSDAPPDAEAVLAKGEEATDRAEEEASNDGSAEGREQRVGTRAGEQTAAFRLQVIRHLRTNRTCRPSAAAAAFQELRPPEPRPVRAHSCFQCSAVFRSKAELLSHQRVHRTRPTYRCSHCDKEFHHLSSLTNHRQTHLGKAGFSCRRCHRVFESAKERDAHRAQHRPAGLACTVCTQAFASQTQLLRHMQTHSVEGAEPTYTCRHCDKTYGSLTGLQSHRASHSADSRFLCSQCGKRFKTRDGLEGHLRTHTGERPYRCPYCPKDFTALAGLNVHVRRHTGERPYVCSVCGKGWPSGGDLQKHMRTHTGERPYVCQDCGKAFSISCHLTEHRRIHTGEKPFSCPDCGKCLRRKFDLKKHMLSHSNVRPHGCSFCPKSYTRKTHLNRHLLTHGTAHSQEAAGAREEEEEAAAINRKQPLDECGAVLFRNKNIGHQITNTHVCMRYCPWRWMVVLRYGMDVCARVFSFSRRCLPTSR
uniref:C2H2-type domain-containing protein n=1 Tax=Salarias fasciatus TaxID=181472 RepID=A0A672HUB8_SALFA